jgi:hypothetical protein
MSIAVGQWPARAGGNGVYARKSTMRMQAKNWFWLVIMGWGLLATLPGCTSEEPDPSPVAARPLKPISEVEIKLPADATVVQTTDSRIDLQLPGGRAKELVAGWKDELLREGWEERSLLGKELEQQVELDQESRALGERFVTQAVLLGRDLADLSIAYTDTQPAEVIIQVKGIRLHAVREGL